MPAGASARVLVVDDDALVLAQILDALSPGRFNVVTAPSATHALTALAAQPSFDLILADLQMPGMDGFELRRRLCANPRTATIPFCFVTTSVRDEDKGMARQLGARAFLRKPVHAEKLLAFVREIVAEAADGDRRRQVAQIAARRMQSIGMAIQLSPDGTAVRAEIVLTKGRLSNAFTRAPIPSVTLQNVDHLRLRMTAPSHLVTLSPIPIDEIADLPSLEKAVVDAYHTHVRARKKEKAILERWRIEAEYEDDACRFVGRVTLGRDDLTFTAVDERTIRLLSSKGRSLGARAREVDVSGATSSVEIAFALEEVLRSLPAAPVAPPPAPKPRLPEVADEPPPLVAGYADPAPPQPGPDALLEPVLLLEEAALEPVDDLCVVCAVCGRRYFLPDELEDDRLLTTCDRCL